MSLCCCDIIALSFRKDDTGRTHVQANMPGVILPARPKRALAQKLVSIFF